MSDAVAAATDAARADDSRPVEVELKYVVADRAALEGALATPSIGGFVVGPASEPQPTEDRYLDSPGGDLALAGFAARLRRTPTGVLLTLKSTDTVDGPTQRRTELEAPAEWSADPGDWPPSPAATAIVETCGVGTLVEIASLRQTRLRRDLVSDAATVELTIDDVDVLADGRVVDSFVECEAELRRGDEAALDALRSALEDIPGLTAASGSKLERALAARTAAGTGADASVDTAATSKAEAAPAPPSDPFLVPRKSPGLLAEDSVAEAGRKVLRFHLARMIAREPGTRLGADAEELHSMRVATRRMRAAWRVFGSGFRPRRTRRYREHLRVVAGRLGEVRDRDVMIEGLERYQALLAEAERPGIEPLLREWRTQRDDSRALLIRELDSDGYRRWLDNYREFVLQEGLAAARTTPTAPHRIRDAGASEIWLAYEQVRAYESVLRWADVPTLHSLRIAAKRLRYTLEFLREALSPEAATLIARVVVLQDHLGALNDADVAATLTRSFLVAHASDLDDAETLVIGRYLTSREQEVARLRRTVGGPWRGVAGLSFRRVLGRVTAAL